MWSVLSNSSSNSNNDDDDSNNNNNNIIIEILSYIGAHAKAYNEQVFRTSLRKMINVKKKRYRKNKH
jgi:hypothetical protein